MGVSHPPCSHQGPQGSTCLMRVLAAATSEDAMPWSGDLTRRLWAGEQQRDPVVDISAVQGR